MKRSALLLSAILSLSACASMPQRTDADGAVNAARNLIRTTKPWADQAIYTAKRENSFWLVRVDCAKCKDSDGGVRDHMFFVSVSWLGKAQSGFGINN